MHLYLHIPFCKQACHYCDFHFSTSLNSKSELVSMMIKELYIQKDYLANKNLESIYFGGGTPSLLTKKEIESIFEAINTIFSIQDKAEITLEANPDDINESNLQNWKSAGINRLSIGIQSFQDKHLSFMNRSHNATEALTCIHLAKSYGFDSLSIDLIYGIPDIDHTSFKEDLSIATALNIPHISAYCLTIEEQTAFGKWVKNNKMKPVDEDFASEQYRIMKEVFNQNGIEQYEISNFARNGAYALHNTSYWQNEPYLGIGPSAHSFDGLKRQWNISNNALYIKGLKSNQIPFESETLTNIDRANEYLMTGLRTKWGVSLEKLGELVNISELEFLNGIKEAINHGLMIKDKQHLFLTEEGKLKADAISSSLFFMA